MTDYDPDAILNDPNAHPKHRAYAEINRRVRDLGEHWTKCLNCGCPYQVTEEWPDTNVCSDGCGGAFAASLFDE